VFSTHFSYAISVYYKQSQKLQINEAICGAIVFHKNHIARIYTSGKRGQK